MSNGSGLIKERVRIGELAADLGVNPKTIRYYEDIGALPRPRRTPAGYRQYGPADRERLAFILKARAIGLTLEEIGDILRLRDQGVAASPQLAAPPCWETGGRWQPDSDRSPIPGGCNGRWCGSWDAPAESIDTRYHAAG